MAIRAPWLARWSDVHQPGLQPDNGHALRWDERPLCLVPQNINIPLPLRGFAVKDWLAAAKLQAPRGWVTAINGATGAVLWQYQAESQVQAGMVPTKSGLLFAGDTHGNLLIFDATTKGKNGSLLHNIDTGAPSTVA